MKKLLSFLGLALLFVAFCAPASAQSGTKAVPELYVCKSDNLQTVEVHVGARAGAGTISVSAVEAKVDLSGLAYVSTEYKGDVNLPATTSGNSVIATTGKVGYFSVAATERTDFFTLTCNVTSGGTVGASFDLEETSIYPGTTGSVNVTPFEMTVDDVKQKISVALSAVPFCTAKCGNGVKEGSEQCDDGNTTNGDRCSSTCQNEAPTSTTPVPPGTVTPTPGTTIPTPPVTGTTGQTTTTTPATQTTPDATASVLPTPDTTATQTETTTQTTTTLSEEEAAAAAAEAAAEAALHGAGTIEPQPVQFRDAAGLGETGPRENAILAFIGAVILIAVVRFRKALL